MTAPVIPALGDATNNRSWLFEFNLNYLISGTPSYTVIGGLASNTFQPDNPNMVSDTDQAGQGFQSSSKTGATWQADLTVIERVNTQTGVPTYDVVQQYLHDKSISKFGQSNRVELRICEYDPNDPTGQFTPRVRAYHGFASASWVPAGGDMLAERTVAVGLMGQGKLDIITHPYAASFAAVPTFGSPAAAPLALNIAGGQLVNIFGRGFTGVVGATGVKFAATNATAYNVESDSLIVAISPAHAAGSGPIVVTNPTGASTTGPTVTYS